MPDVAYRGIRPHQAAWTTRLLILGIIGGVVLLVLKFDQVTAFVAGFFPEKPEELGPDQVRIYVAAQNIPAFTRIEPHMLKEVVKKKAVVEEEEKKGLLTKPEEILYRVTLEPIEESEGFRDRKLASRDAPQSPKVGIPPGWAAVTLNVETIQGPTAHLNQGDKVGVLAAWPAGEGTPRRVSVISRSAQVLVPPTRRVAGEEEEGGGNPLVRHGHGRTRPKIVEELMLSMPPEDLVRLSRAQGIAQIHLVLLGSRTDEFPLAELPGADSFRVIELIQGDRTSASVIEGGHD